MTEEEQMAAIGDGLEKLEERRKNRKEGVQNVLINSFHSMHVMLSVVQRKVCRLLFLMLVYAFTRSYAPSSRLLQVAPGCAFSPSLSTQHWTPTMPPLSSSATLV